MLQHSCTAAAAGLDSAAVGLGRAGGVSAGGSHVLLAALWVWGGCAAGGAEVAAWWGPSGGVRSKGQLGKGWRVVC